MHHMTHSSFLLNLMYWTESHEGQHLHPNQSLLAGYLRYQKKKTRWTMRKSTAFTTTGEHHAWLIVIYMRRLNDGIGRRLRDRSVRSHSSTRSIRAIWKRPGKHILYGSQSFVAQAKNEYCVERPTLLGAMISPARRPLVFEAWSPCEIATFEGVHLSHTAFRRHR